MRWLISLASLALGLVALRLSYVAYGKWQEYIALGDPSGAELYEVEFWPEAAVAVLLIALGGVFAGLALRAGRHR
jgi:LPS O-antigen subunit length determinant protein (WzzB/FepE family)